MAFGVVVQYAGIGQEQYDAVNKALGIDPTTREGDWPAGLLMHSAGPLPDGWAVIEVWDSREWVYTFMESRLGRALGEAGVTAHPTVITTELVSYVNP